MSGYPPPAPGHPLRGLRWGLLIGVVAAVALFAVVLVVEARGSGEPQGAGTVAPYQGGPGSGAPSGPSGGASSSPAPSSPTPSSPAPSSPGPSTGAPSGAGPGGGAGGMGSSRPAPAATGAILTGGAPAPGWETDGWSWDSTVTPGARGPDGRPAVSVTYAKPFGGFALRGRAVTRPTGREVLQVRVYVVGSAVRLGLQVQSADDGGLGPVVQRDVPSGRWVTLAATVPELRPPAGVKRVSVIAQGVPPGTRVWVSEVALR